MTSPRLTYYDFSSSRGEEIRIALRLANMPFDDNRIAREDYPDLKPTLPFPYLPMFEMDGLGRMTQTNTILRVIGRLNGLYPDDVFAAAKVDAIMDAVEDARARFSATFQMDEDRKLLARQKLAIEFIPHWGKGIESYMEGPFTCGDAPCVADVKLYMVDRWISQGGLDNIPADSFDAFKKIKSASAGIAALADVAS